MQHHPHLINFVDTHYHMDKPEERAENLYICFSFESIAASLPDLIQFFTIFTHDCQYHGHKTQAQHTYTHTHKSCYIPPDVITCP